MALLGLFALFERNINPSKTSLNRHPHKHTLPCICETNQQIMFLENVFCLLQVRSISFTKKAWVNQMRKNLIGLLATDHLDLCFLFWLFVPARVLLVCSSTFTVLRWMISGKKTRKKNKNKLLSETVLWEIQQGYK